MTNRSTTTRKAPRAKVAAAVLAAVMVAPVAAVANHTTCDNSGPPSAQCPSMSVDLLAGPQIPYTSSYGGLTFRMTQPDESTPVLDVQYLVPKGWGFAVSNLTPAKRNDGTVSTPGNPATCDGSATTGIYSSAAENHTDDAAAQLRNAENLAGGVGMTIRHVRARGSNPAVNYGYTRRQARGGSNFDVNPSLAFLHWDNVNQKASLCMYLYTANTNVDDSGGSVQYAASQNQLPRQIILPIELTKLPASADFGWNIHFDLTRLYNDASLFSDAASLTQHLFYIEGLTGGNWHKNLSNQPERMQFSRTPTEPGVYEFKGIFKGCLSGFELDGYGTAPHPGRLVPGTFSDMCKTADVVTAERSLIHEIRHAPSTVVHEIATLTGPGTTNLPTGFGLVRNTSTINLQWRQPRANPFESIKGYVVSMAKPGDVNNIRQEYVVTDPTAMAAGPEDPGFDARQPCGATGGDLNCTLPLNFPADTSGTPLLEDGKYDFSLITIYKDGHRSDKRCDDGTPQGATCPIQLPAFNVAPPGITQWQVMLRSKQWPNAYANTATVRGNCCPGGTAPNQVLLLDMVNREAQFIEWNAFGTEKVRAASSNTMYNVNGTYVIDFNSGNTFSGAESWRITARGNSSSISGEFFKYNANGPIGTGMRSSFTVSAIG